MGEQLMREERWREGERNDIESGERQKERERDMRKRERGA